MKHLTALVVLLTANSSLQAQVVCQNLGNMTTCNGSLNMGATIAPQPIPDFGGTMARQQALQAQARLADEQARLAAAQTEYMREQTEMLRRQQEATAEHELREQEATSIAANIRRLPSDQLHASEVSIETALQHISPDSERADDLNSRLTLIKEELTRRDAADAKTQAVQPSGKADDACSNKFLCR